MPVMTAWGDAQHPPRVPMDEAALERVASELLYPLTVIQLNAEQLLQQFRQADEDPTTVDAAQALIRSVARMNQIVQTLMQEGSGTRGSGQAERSGRALDLVG